eukprot:2773845-Rhodomonas_salina.3
MAGSDLRCVLPSGWADGHVHQQQRRLVAFQLISNDAVTRTDTGFAFFRRPSVFSNIPKMDGVIEPVLSPTSLTERRLGCESDVSCVQVTERSQLTL